jgi:hypothetical protein
MGRWLGALAVGGLALGIAGSAAAAPLNWAGTFSTILSDLGVVSNTGGGVATVNDSSGGVPAHLQTLRLKASRGGVTATQTIFITDPDTQGNSIAAVVVEGSLATGTFAPISGGASSTTPLTRNLLPLRGQARICLLTTDCADFLVLPLTQPTLTVNGAPGGGVIGVGVGGLLTVGGDSPIKISLQAAPWTIKTAVAIDHVQTTGKVNTLFITLKAEGFAHDPASGTTSTAQPSGVVQLVTPAQVQTNLPLGTSKKLGIVATLRVHFIPEPGLLVLLASGVAGLLLLGRRRLRG